MKIKLLEDKNLYATEAEKHLGVFAGRRWLSVYGEQLKVAGIFRDDEKLIGGFFYYDTKKTGLKFVKLPPYTPYCGLWFVSENSNQSARNNLTKEILGEVGSYFNALKAALLVLAVPPGITDLQPFIWSNYKVIPNYTYRIDLSRDMQQIIANFDPKNRNAINKAIKDGVEIVENEFKPADLYEFFNSSLLSAGANVYGAELKKIFEAFSDYKQSFCLCAKQNGIVLGIVYCLFDSKSCYYLLGGIDKQHKQQGVNNLLILKSIEKAKVLGCSVFDFEGSMLRGVEKFFRGFGGEIYPYYTINKGWKLLEMLLKFKKPEVF